MASAYEVLLLLSCIACAMTGISILVRDPDEVTNRTSSAIVLGGAFWAFCEILWNRADDPTTVMVLVKLSALGWVAIGPLGLRMLLEVSGQQTDTARNVLRVLCVAAGGLLMVDWLTPWIHMRVVRMSWGWSYQLGPAYLSFYVITISSLIAGLVLVGRDLRSWPSLGERAQAKGLIIGILIPMVIASVTDGLLPLFDVHVWHLGTASIAVLGVTVTWTFHRYGYSMLAPGTFAREILETLPDGVALLHLDGRIRRVNPVMLELAAEETADDLMGVPISALLDGEITASLDIRRDVEMRLTPMGADNSTPVAVSTRVLCDRLDQPTGLVVVVRDLREVVNLRQRILIGGRMAAVGQLAAGVAHELNNPIAYVRANLSMLMSHWESLRGRDGHRDEAAVGDEGETPETMELWREGGELIAESLEGIDRATSIVRDIRNFSHSGSHSHETVQVEKLLDATVRLASPQLRHRAHVARSLGDLPMVNCAPREIQQVFLNLLLNAVDASSKPENGVLPTVRIATSSEGGTVQIRFVDEGEGIPEAILARVFDPFFTTKAAGEGTGLGLAISYEIIRRHGGEISVESEPGRGSCFTVVIPCGDKENGEEAENADDSRDAPSGCGIEGRIESN